MTCAAVGLATAIAAGQSAPGDAPVIRAPDGRSIRLQAPEMGVLVLVFYSTECPISNAYSPTLNGLVRAYPADRFRLVGLCTDPDRTDAQLAEHKTEYELSFPVAADRGLAVARRYGVTKTPEAVALDASGRVRYRGRIDDQFAARSKKNRHPRTHELRDAIDALLTGREVEQPEVPAVGCPLPEIAESDPAPARPSPPAP
jgi:peroxiredoxin